MSGPPTVQRCARRFSPRRKGIAPLEFVLSLPILVAVTGVIFWIGLAGLGKSHVAHDARYKVWSAVNKDNRPEDVTWTESSQPQRFAMTPLSGHVVGENSIGISTPYPSRFGPPRAAASGGALLFDTWSVEFAAGAFQPPHLDILAQTGNVLQSDLSNLQQFAQALAMQIGTQFGQQLLDNMFQQLGVLQQAVGVLQGEIAKQLSIVDGLLEKFEALDLLGKLGPGGQALQKKIKEVRALIKQLERGLEAIDELMQVLP